MSPLQCPTCGGATVICEVRDAYYCEACDTWAEPKCSGAQCQFCKDRPDLPSSVDREDS